MILQISVQPVLFGDPAFVTVDGDLIADMQIVLFGKDVAVVYIFDIDKFTSFEGNTGPYILYTIVRIKSILAKYKAQGGDPEKAVISDPINASEKDLMKAVASFAQNVESAAADLAPHRVCAFIYDLANAFNSFYHETMILKEEDEEKKSGFIALLKLTRDILETCIDMLGFEAPERM